jgi:tripartite-type tricarboxylate transporter receptor subunit TctC
LKRITALTALLACTSLPATALAQSYPVKTVRVICPTGPGGGADVQARLMSKRFTESMGQPFVVENRPGASGIIGTESAAKAPPDGYTLLVTSSLIAISASVYKKLPFDPLRDLAPVSLIASAPQVLIVHPSVPAKSVKELVALSKRQKSGLNGGHNGSGTTSHIGLEMMAQHTGANIVQIPYKGGGPTTLALLSGEIDLCFSTLTTVKPHVETGRLRALAVTTKKPSSIMPTLPTMDSTYPGFETDNWFAMFAATGTPKEIVAKLHGLAVEALRSPELRNFISKDGGDVVASTPEELGAHLRTEIARYAKVIKAGNIKLD